MTGKQAAALAVFYIWLGIFTFGHAANNASCGRAMYKSECGVASGIMGAMFWPLYWSWELQE